MILTVGVTWVSARLYDAACPNQGQGYPRGRGMQELRAISFTERELMTAIVEFTGRLNRKLPVGMVKDPVIVEGPPITVQLPIEDDYGKMHEATFAEMEVAAALVNYCMTRKIRMPAKAEKVLQIISGAATLVIWLGEQEVGAQRKKATLRNR